MGSLFGMSGGKDASLMDEMASRLAHRGSPEDVFTMPTGGALAGYSEGLSSQPWLHKQLAMVGEVNIFNIDTMIRILADDGFQAENADAGQLLLSAWAVLGPAALLHVNGDFAIAIADLDTGVMHLARDRSGTKPLYYTHIGGRWVFASEYKALLAIPDLVREINLDAMHMLHARKVVPAARTLIKNVLQVPAQTVVTLCSGGRSNVNRYWRPRGEVRRADFAWHRDRIASTFLRAVERRTSDFGRLGISVSGGVDSIALVAAARKTHPEANISTYTIGDSIDDPEVTVARRVADHYATDHHEQVFSTDNLAARMRHLVWGLEDPIARTETLMTYDVCAVAHEDVDVMLRGDGADGLFGGMARHKILALAERIPFASSTLTDIYTFTQSGTMPTNFISRALIKSYFRSKIPAPPAVIGYSEKSVSLVAKKLRSELLNHTLWKGPEHALPMLLQKVERPHALFGMQSVSPFLDNDLVEAAHQVPSLFKNNGMRSKIVFREAVSQFLPEKFARLPKYAQRVRETRGFCDALDAIARDDEVVRSLIDRNLFAARDLALLLARPANGIWSPEHAMRVWTLILTEYWFQIFLDSDGEFQPVWLSSDR